MVGLIFPYIIGVQNFKIFVCIYCVGIKSTCINAATLALINAGIPMKDYVCACSASFVEQQSILGDSIKTCIPLIILLTNYRYQPCRRTLRWTRSNHCHSTQVRKNSIFAGNIICYTWYIYIKFVRNLLFHCIIHSWACKNQSCMHKLLSYI